MSHRNALDAQDLAAQLLPRLRLQLGYAGVPAGEVDVVLGEVLVLLLLMLPPVSPA